VRNEATPPASTQSTGTNHRLERICETKRRVLTGGTYPALVRLVSITQFEGCLGDRGGSLWHNRCASPKKRALMADRHCAPGIMTDRPFLIRTQRCDDALQPLLAVAGIHLGRALRRREMRAGGAQPAQPIDHGATPRAGEGERWRETAFVS